MLGSLIGRSTIYTKPRFNPTEQRDHALDPYWLTSWDANKKIESLSNAAPLRKTSSQSFYLMEKSTASVDFMSAWKRWSKNPGKNLGEKIGIADDDITTKIDHKILLNRLVYWLWIVIVHPDLHIDLIYIYSIHYRTSVGCDSMLWMFICQLHASLLWTSFMIQFFLQIGLKVLKGKILLSCTCHQLVHLVQVDCAQYLSGHWSLANSAVDMAVVLLPNYSQPKRYCNTPSSSIWKIEGFLSAIISRQLRKRMTWV